MLTLLFLQKTCVYCVTTRLVLEFRMSLSTSGPVVLVINLGTTLVTYGANFLEHCRALNSIWFLSQCSTRHIDECVRFLFLQFTRF